jgi:hypothetical protein
VDATAEHLLHNLVMLGRRYVYRCPGTLKTISLNQDEGMSMEDTT